MRNVALSRMLIWALLALLITSCTEDDDFEIPRDAGASQEIEGTEIPLSAVLGQLEQANADGDETFTYEETDAYFTGYVVSSDEGGNFFEELIIQDKPENPTAGIRVLIDSSPLFGQYNFGRKVFVKLDGLTVGTDSGVVSLGIQSGNEVEALPESFLSETVLRDNVTEEIVPLEVTMQDFSDDLENLFISLPSVQFPRSSVLEDEVLTFASEPTDDFDGERVLESCLSGSSTILSTSTFSDFKSLELPADAGRINAVLSRNFFDDMYILIINDPSDLVFDQERCDPDFLLCDGESGGPDTIYSEDFENVNSISQLSGWENIQVEGTQDYVIGSFDNNNYAQISGFQSGETFTSWLVTEEIDLSTTSLEELSLDIQSNFDNGTILEIYITDNYSGDVTTTEWDLLDLSIPVGDDGFGSFEPVGPVNISCAGENIRIGFKYEGEDPGPTTRYHIDNITIEGQQN